MKDLFIRGGAPHMAVLTLLLIITTAWIIYHFIIASKSKQTDKEILLRKIAYGKSMGLFTMIFGISGQMTGLYHMFMAIEDSIRKGLEVKLVLIFEAIRVTMIVTFYGIFIYLFSLLLWFVSTILIEKKLNNKQH